MSDQRGQDVPDTLDITDEAAVHEALQTGIDITRLLYEETDEAMEMTADRKAGFERVLTTLERLQTHFMPFNPELAHKVPVWATEIYNLASRIENDYSQFEQTMERINFPEPNPFPTARDLQRDVPSENDLENALYDLSQNGDSKAIAPLVTDVTHITLRDGMGNETHYEVSDPIWTDEWADQDRIEAVWSASDE